MKALITAMLLLHCFTSGAQTDEDVELLPTPKILALDMGLSKANAFNTEIARIAEGYKLAFTEKSIPKTVRQVYKTDKNETMRIEYQYGMNEGDADDAGNKPVITFQKIGCDEALLVKIYNHLFGTDIQPGQISAIATPGTEINYGGEVHQMIIEADDYAPGYWTISFVR